MSKDFLNQTKNPSNNQFVPAGRHPLGPLAPIGVFSTDVHDNLIRSKGFKSIHWRHALSANRTSIEGGVDLSNPADVGAMNLYDPKPFYMAIQQISWQDQAIVQGLHGSSTLSANYTTYYEGPAKERVFLRKYDVIHIESGHTVMVGQLFEYKPNGPQRLKFPIKEVDYLADGNKVRYEQGVDFIVNDGMIEWIGNRPSWDASRGRGATLSINYWTTPYFAVVDTPRAMREVFSNSPGASDQTSNGTYISGSVVLKMLWLDDSFQFDLPDWPRALEPQRTFNTRS